MDLSKHSVTNPLRIVSYNVRYFGHALRGLASTRGIKRGIAAGICGMDPLPDIICLQEVETSSIRSSLAFRKDKPEQTQLEAFMVRMEEAFAARKWEMPYEAFYFRAHTYGFKSLPIYTTGLAVLVNVKKLKVEGHNVDSPHHITHHHIAALKDRKQSRICAHMRLTDSAGRRFHIFNTHLSLPTPFTKTFWTEKERMGFGLNQLAEAKTLVEFIRKHAGEEPFIVCGDFNSAPASPTFSYLCGDAGLNCAQLSCGQLSLEQPRAFPTAGFMHLRMHLDHLFSGGTLKWLDLENTKPFGDPSSPFAGLSDHMPLIARFELS